MTNKNISMVKQKKTALKKKIDDIFHNYKTETEKSTKARSQVARLIVAQIRNLLLIAVVENIVLVI